MGDDDGDVKCLKLVRLSRVSLQNEQNQIVW